MRVGIGYDSHRFDPSRPLILGGHGDSRHLRAFPATPMGMLWPTPIIDALLGAVRRGRCGKPFPSGRGGVEGGRLHGSAPDVRPILEEGGYRTVECGVVVVIPSAPRSGPVAEAIRRAWPRSWESAEDACFRKGEDQ